MTTPRLDDAHALVARLNLALTEIVGATATLHASEISSGARAGAVLVQPPPLEFPTTATEYNAKWPVHLIAGPARDPVQAWATLDALLQALLENGLPITNAEPASFQPQQGEALPAYTLTING